jgi:hypothetical protein
MFYTDPKDGQMRGTGKAEMSARSGRRIINEMAALQKTENYKQACEKFTLVGYQLLIIEYTPIRSCPPLSEGLSSVHNLTTFLFL